MNQDKLQQYWFRARTLLLAFRASINNETPTSEYPERLKRLRGNLEDAARDMDDNRRTSDFNMKSVDQDAMTAIASNAEYLAKKWLDAGRPQVPVV